jgi:hypothetical protein
MCAAATRRRAGDRRGAAGQRARRGHPPIAERIERPPATARGWLRAGQVRAELLRASGSRWAFALDSSLGRFEPDRSSLGDAVEALATAARAWLLRLGRPGLEPWEIVLFLTGGQLLIGRPREPPGF